MLEIREIDVAYGDVQIIYGVSLQVAKGETISLVGSNGAGKTTIMKTISGLLKPSSGEIVFEKNLSDILLHACTKGNH